MSEAEAKAAARKLLDGGDGFLKAGDKLLKRKKTADAQAQYERALAAYQKAFELVPNPQILFPVAVAHDKLGHWAEAARNYRRFLTQVAAPDPGLKAEAEKRLEAAKLNLGVVSLVVTPDGAHVTLSGTEIGVAPLADPLFLDAGEYTLAFDADGYFKEPTVSELAADEGVSEELVEKVLEKIQTFDPTGIGARNLQECLSLQLRALPDEHDRNVALLIVDKHLELLAARDFAKLRRVTGYDDEDLKAAQGLITSLNPRPAAGYAQVEARYITPDVIVKKLKGKWTAYINPDAYPRLRINRLYASLLQQNRAQGGGQRQAGRET